MKIALLSGAYKNAGDFLIVKRSKELLTKVYPESIITEYERRKDLTPVLDEINQSDVLVLAGGPGYQTNIYPTSIPLIEDLDKIKTKIFVLGMGWKGRDTSNRTVYNYKFTDATSRLLKKIENDGFPLGCRDWYSVRALKNNGFKNAKMTGCPAWYNLEFVNTSEVARAPLKEIKKIVVSDPADMKNLDLAIHLVRYLKRKFPQSEIKFVFHRGVEQDLNTPSKLANNSNSLKKEVENMGIECMNIAYGSEGFNLYNDCDLHIGFRVHAHIYNLSCRNLSILIEEDGRGAGVNEALGLQSITAYSDMKCDLGNKYISKLSNKVLSSRNSYLENNVDDYIQQLCDSDYLQITNAFLLMQQYYKHMIEHLKLINNKR
ncbi:polysaccharide pyruvyl transferase family protein [Clostridium sp.]|uniref:polysaccharide pyruvyl transferase family protein n=1 Tax=Clostridium sp. TaxID=1506 RepID=UPI003217C7AE